MAKLQWKFDSGEDDPEWLENQLTLTGEELEELRPENQWTAEWWPGGVRSKEHWPEHLSFRVTEVQEGGYLFCVSDYTETLPERPWVPSRLPKLVEFATLAEAQQYAQQVYDDMTQGWS
jgi:hypothetical protein